MALVTGLAPALGDGLGLAAIAAKQDRGISLNSLVLLAAEQPVDRLAKVLALEVPEGHIDGGHGGDRDRRAAKVQSAAVHLLPQPLGFQGILAEQQLAKPAGDVVAERERR